MLESVFVFIFGLCMGSFLNVCIYRLPKEKSIINPRSFCPHCSKPIKWYDNIPLLSYLFLKGRCRQCGQKIAWRYPVVEVITAVLFLFLYVQVGFNLLFLEFIFLFSVLILVSFIDIEYHAIPAYICIIGILGGLFMKAVASWPMLKEDPLSVTSTPLFRSLKGMIFGFGFVYFFKLLGDLFISVLLRIRKKDSIEGEKESLGLGDVDFMGMIGVFMGIKGVVLTFFIAPFFAVLYSVFALMFRKSHLIPYLPYLSLAAITTFFWGHKILAVIF
ncbi:MAG: hypothetical protein GF375_01440 [Candidatus Omnitrophica bacterium]|nr:hypothetical protein [Candidatus Omnitrophota bacterium]MBD3268794.1 hypothetical protein [Candidatus Omnitrophota bacterium]